MEENKKNIDIKKRVIYGILAGFIFIILVVILIGMYVPVSSVRITNLANERISREIKTDFKAQKVLFIFSIR